MPRFTGIHHLALTVSNLDASTAFYQLVFGFPPASELGGENLRRRLFTLPSGTNLGLTEHNPTTTETFTPFRPGMDHVGFAVDTTDASSSRGPNTSPSPASSTADPSTRPTEQRSASKTPTV